jgi:hypothetical protein
MPKHHLAGFLLLLVASPGMAANDTPTGQAAPATRPATGHARPEGGIMRYDKNNDGVVERAEWQAAQEKRFKRLDTDHDGKLSQDELMAGAKKGTEEQEQRKSAAFKRLDADKNGVVALDEFLAQGKHAFARCDSNGDGRTNAQECGAR